MILQRKMVIALGGNAISSSDGSGDIPTQFAQSRHTARYIADLLCAGHHLVITHGNGPQVGKCLRRVELSRHEVYPIDLGLCVADTQSAMGYMISQCLRNEMHRRGQPCRDCTIVTTVRVDADDPAFDNPSKPIGQYYDEATAQARVQSDGWHVKAFPGKGFRRVVPSPEPRQIMELPLIQRLFEDGLTVICAGGGGIPIVVTEDGGQDGVEAVIDKDLTAAQLAAGIHADTLAILTDVPQVCLHYGTPAEQALDRLTVAQAQAYLQAGEFPAGSMGPKIEACLRFLASTRRPDAVALITRFDAFEDALAGRAGTRIIGESADRS